MCGASFMFTIRLAYAGCVILNDSETIRFSYIYIYPICCRDQILIAMQKCGVWLQILWMTLVDSFTFIF